MELKSFGWAVVSNCGTSKSSILYTKKEEADEHCEDWNKDEGLGYFRPYRAVELFQRDEPQRDAV